MLDRKCYTCGFYDSDFDCVCPSMDRWYACPIESKKPENQKELEEMAKWYEEKDGVENDKEN